ncbi:MAG TPA: hypothetical protein VIH40_00340 [Xanthobacteraceae bacterium]
MELDAYLREQAAKFRQLAEEEQDVLSRLELLDLADVCEEIANSVEDRLPSG